MCIERAVYVSPGGTDAVILKAIVDGNDKINKMWNAVNKLSSSVNTGVWDYCHIDRTYVANWNEILYLRTVRFIISRGM